MNQKDELIAIINYIKIEKFSEKTDFAWSQYNNMNEAIKDFDNIIQCLNENDNSIFQEISVLFLPTGELQELSLSNGWGDEFLIIASKVDILLAQLTL